jgi:hypothetical protein
MLAIAVAGLIFSHRLLWASCLLLVRIGRDRNNDVASTGPLPVDGFKEFRRTKRARMMSESGKGDPLLKLYTRASA